MASGTLNSGQVRVAAQTPAAAQASLVADPPAPEILRSGERVATSQAALADPNSKTYFNMVKGSNFVMPNGLCIQFLGGRYVTNEPDQIAELDKVANRAGSLIFTKAEAKQADEALARQAAAETLDSDGTSGKIEAAVQG